MVGGREVGGRSRGEAREVEEMTRGGVRIERRRGGGGNDEER